MTAEIGVLNRTGVALAADSAVTIGNGRNSKVFNTANKLFNLSKWHPVGIMIYSNADFMNVPWETIIKSYRSEISEIEEDYLKIYGDNFIKYIKDNSDKFISKYAEDNFVKVKFRECLEYIIDEVNNKIRRRSKTSDPTEETIQKKFSEVTKSYINKLKEMEYLNEFDENFEIEFLEVYKEYIIGIIHDSIDINIDQETQENLIYIAHNILSKDVFNSYTGIVISGYGKEEIFPSLINYKIDGWVCGRLKYKVERIETIDSTKNTASVIPFAQSDGVHSFIEGIDPKLRIEWEKTMNSVINSIPNVVENVLKSNYGIQKLKSEDYEMINKNLDGLRKVISSTLQNYQIENFVSPILNIISILPKDELVSVAEALINLTSLKRKISHDLETVGGPIDSAVITKGDGFIWIKRKHYFDADLNYSFFQKYLKEE